MPEIMCDAVTCRHNAGNVAGAQGMFKCTADIVAYGTSEVKCDECGLPVDATDCKTYERVVTVSETAQLETEPEAATERVEFWKNECMKYAAAAHACFGDGVASGSGT